MAALVYTVDDLMVAGDCMGVYGPLAGLYPMPLQGQTEHGAVQLSSALYVLLKAVPEVCCNAAVHAILQRSST